MGVRASAETTLEVEEFTEREWKYALFDQPAHANVRLFTLKYTLGGMSRVIWGWAINPDVDEVELVFNFFDFN